jgi:hypothetical protein
VIAAMIVAEKIVVEKIAATMAPNSELVLEYQSLIKCRSILAEFLFATG